MAGKTDQKPDQFVSLSTVFVMTDLVREHIVDLLNVAAYIDSDAWLQEKSRRALMRAALTAHRVEDRSTCETCQLILSLDDRPRDPIGDLHLTIPNLSLLAEFAWLTRISPSPSGWSVTVLDHSEQSAVSAVGGLSRLNRLERDVLSARLREAINKRVDQLTATSLVEQAALLDPRTRVVFVDSTTP